MAGSTGLEPAASGVTGRRSNQLNYDPKGNASIEQLVNVSIGKLNYPMTKFSDYPILCASCGRYRIRTCDSRRVKPVLYH